MRGSHVTTIVFLLMALGAILYFGLRTKSFERGNDAVLIDGGSGLRFGGSGMAYAASPPLPDVESFSIDLALEQDRSPSSGAAIILAIHDGRDTTQLVVWQWRSLIIVRNSDDFDHTRRLPRLRVDAAPLPESFLLTVSTGPEGSRLYADGILAAENPNLHLRIPQSPDRVTRMVFGNSVRAQQPWTGAIHGLALRSGETTADRAVEIFDRWESRRSLASSGDGSPILLQASDCPSANPGLVTIVPVIPQAVFVLQRRVLDFRLNSGGSERAIAFDIVVNVIGFIPFGLFGYAFLAVVGDFRSRSRVRELSARTTKRMRNLTRPRGTYRARALLTFAVVVVSGCLLSLALEIAQSWMPSRYSSLLDLLLNTLGASLGAGVMMAVRLRAARA